MSILRTSACLVSAACLITACGDNHDHSGHNHDTPDAAVTPDAPAATTMNVAIPFVAHVNGMPFACDQLYSNIGTSNATYKGQDFRFFVSNLKLTPAGGGAGVPVVLTVNENQDANGIALLDFENGTGLCQTGTVATYTTVVGTVPTGTYNGITFDLGIPFEHNHINYATATGPRSAPGMFWSWQGGYKFAKIEGQIQTATDPKPVFNLHLGSTGCVANNSMEAPTMCANPNRPTIALASFVVGQSKVVADVGPVLATTNVATNTAMTAPGCMSFPGDPECNNVLPRLGVPYGGTPAAPQQLFTLGQ